MKILRWVFVFGCLCYFALAFASQNRTEKNVLICHLQLGQLSAAQIMQKFNHQAHKNRAFVMMYADGEWVIKAAGKNNFIKFYVDRNTGKITGRKTYSSQDAFDYAHTATWSNRMLPLSKIVSLLAQAGYSDIERVQWVGDSYVARVCYKHKWNNIRINSYSGSLVRVKMPRLLGIQ